MDIFTTQLTRVVPVPIKPASLKVKALLKEAGANKLKDDPNHVENHDYYVGENKHAGDQDKHQKGEQEQTAEEQSSMSNKQSDEVKQKESDANDGVKHLDLYV